MTILPSAFASLVNEADETYTLYGGGYGHGLGMSQNGANGLAKPDELSRYFAFLL